MENVGNDLEKIALRKTAETYRTDDAIGKARSADREVISSMKIKYEFDSPSDTVLG